MFGAVEDFQQCFLSLLPWHCTCLDLELYYFRRRRRKDGAEGGVFQHISASFYQPLLHHQFNNILTSWHSETLILIPWYPDTPILNHSYTLKAWHLVCSRVGWLSSQAQLRDWARLSPRGFCRMEQGSLCFKNNYETMQIPRFKASSSILWRSASDVAGVPLRHPGARWAGHQDWVSGFLIISFILTYQSQNHTFAEISEF